MNIYDLQEERERKRVQNWKVMTSFQKHMALMYLYRVLTDLGHVRDYIETYEFLKMEITPDDLPSYLAKVPPEELRKEAYEVIGQHLPEGSA